MTTQVKDWDDLTGRPWEERAAFGKALDSQLIPPPEGTTTGEYWGSADENGVRNRVVDFGSHWTGETVASMCATQYSDGRVEPFIVAGFTDKDGNEQFAYMSPKVAHELAVSLSNACSDGTPDGDKR